MKDYYKEFKGTGEVELIIDSVVKQWNRLCWISQYRDKYRLIKNKRKDSAITTVKCTISELQAKELIEKLELIPISCPPFKNATSWRREQDFH